MKMTRPKKSRLLKKSGLIYVAGWVDREDKPKVDDMIKKQLELVRRIVRNEDE